MLKVVLMTCVMSARDGAKNQTKFRLMNKLNMFAFLGMALLWSSNFWSQTEGSTVLFEESFDGYSSLGIGFDGSTNTAVGQPDWFIQYDNSADYFQTSLLSGDTVFAGGNLGGDCSWTSKLMEVSDYTNLQVSIDASHMGNWENMDFFRFEAILDASVFGSDILTIAEFNNDFGSQQIGPFALPNAFNIRLRVVTRTNAADEVIYFDDILLTGDLDCPDADADGVCDDVDACVGTLDACGVCNGPGAIYECGCAEIPAGDCDCNGNQLDATGVCGGTCASDLDGDGFVAVNDILSLLSEFGCLGGSCIGDVDGDESVGVSDILTILSAFGVDCAG